MNEVFGFFEFREMKHERSAEAKKLLERLADKVKPLMVKHRWKVPLFSEFFPSNGSLLGLNVNMGQEIRIRLRPKNDPKSFLDMESLLQTTAHELVHNKIGPHNADFYKFFDTLMDDLDYLYRRNRHIEGESVKMASYLAFSGRGQKLGTGSRIHPNRSVLNARDRAVESAKKRIKSRNNFTKSLADRNGGRRLGSGKRSLNDFDLSSVQNAIPPREVAVLAAYQRHMRDSLWCGSNSHASSKNNESSHASNLQYSDKNYEIIDLTGE